MLITAGEILKAIGKGAGLALAVLFGCWWFVMFLIGELSFSQEANTPIIQLDTNIEPSRREELVYAARCAQAWLDRTEHPKPEWFEYPDERWLRARFAGALLNITNGRNLEEYQCAELEEEEEDG